MLIESRHFVIAHAIAVSKNRGDWWEAGNYSGLVGLSRTRTQKQNENRSRVSEEKSLASPLEMNLKSVKSFSRKSCANEKGLLSHIFQPAQKASCFDNQLVGPPRKADSHVYRPSHCRDLWGRTELQGQQARTSIHAKLLYGSFLLQNEII